MSTYPKVGEEFLSTLREVVKLRLYLLTLVVQALTAGLVRRWFAQRIWLAAGWIHPLPMSPEFIGWICMLGPLIWSLSAFWFPGGGGGRWYRKAGAVEPSRGEGRRIELAFETLGEAATRRLRELSIRIIDTADRFSFIRGTVLLYSRGLVESDDVVPVTAHELGHTCTIDGRLMLALDRLSMFGNPLSQTPDEDIRRESGAGAAGLLACLRWLVQLAGGTLTLRVMWPLWAHELRKRERAADAYAVALGQGPPLAAYLKNWQQPTDRPLRRMLFLFNMQNHDRAAYRLDILLQEPEHSPQWKATELQAIWHRFCDWLALLLEGRQTISPETLFEPARRMVQTVFANGRITDEKDIDLQAWVLAAMFAEHPVQLTRSQLVTRVRTVAEDDSLPVEEAIANLQMAQAIDVDDGDVVSLMEPALVLREHALL